MINQTIDSNNTKDVDIETDTTIPVSPLVVFVATLPDKFNRSSPCLAEIEKLKDAFNLVVLHPYYDFASEIGKKTLTMIGDPVPTYSDPWETIMRKDFFCIQNSDLVFFDLDVPDISHFLGVAASYNKPIIGVSSNLLSIPVYFSGSVICIVKPNKISDILRLTLEDDNFLKLPHLVTFTPASEISESSSNYKQEEKNKED